MTLKIDPALGTSYGWDIGESGWGSPMNENLLRFSILLNRRFNSVVTTLPVSPVEGDVHFLSTDNLLYYYVDDNWYYTEIPTGFELIRKSDEQVFKFNGTSLIEVTYLDEDNILPIVESIVDDTLADYLRSVSTIAELRAVDGVTNETVIYWSNQELSGVYRGDTTNTDPDDGMYTVVSANGVRLVLDSDRTLFDYSADLTNRVDDQKGTALVGHRGESLREYLDSTKKVNSFFSGRINAQRRNNQWGIRTINILGDSISHGANAPDIPNDAWTGIFRKMANAEFGGSNYGFCGINATISNPEGTYQEFHNVATTGTWTGSTTVDNPSLIGGFSFNSAGAGNILTITVPAVHKFFRIWYMGLTNGGDYLIRINGVESSIETTTVGLPAGLYPSTPFAITDNGYGHCVIELITQDSDPVQIMGVGYYDETSEFQVNNFSQSGRRIEYLSNDVINWVCSGADLLIFALGHNDQAAVGASQTTITARIDHLISTANASDTKVLILDFCWAAAQSTFIRSELLRASRAIERAEIISFPDLFYLNGAIATSSYLIDTLEFLSDGSHPSVFGHRMIAETVAKILGYTTSSKKQAQINDNRWTPIVPINGWRNGDGITAVRRSGNDVMIKLNIDGTFKTTDVIANLPSWVNIDTACHCQFFDSTGVAFRIAIPAGSGSSIDYATLGVVDYPLSAVITLPCNNINEFII